MDRRTKSRRSLPGADAAPPYRRIENDLRRRVQAAEWADGALLPNRRELAAEYGVTTNTVSRAVAALVEEGVLGTTKRHGTFVSSSDPGGGAASAPAATVGNRESVVVGLVCVTQPDEPTTGWGPIVRRVAEDALSSLNVATRAVATENPGSSLKDAIEEATSGGVDAVLVAYLFENPAWVEAATDLHMSGRCPLMLVTTEDIRQPVPHTFTDERASGFIAADHLVRAGYEKLCVIAPFAQPEWLAQRIDGARMAVRRSGREQLALTVHPHEPSKDWTWWDANRGKPGAQRLVAGLVDEALENMDFEGLATGSCAFIAPNDRVAAGIGRALRARGLTPGIDVGVVGFDDIPEAAETGLTSIRQPLAEMARTAARLLVAAVGGETLPIKVCESARLILRDSTRRAISKEDRPHQHSTTGGKR